MEKEWRWNGNGMKMEKESLLQNLIETKENRIECRVRFQAEENVAEVGVF